MPSGPPLIDLNADVAAPQSQDRDHRAPTGGPEATGGDDAMPDALELKPDGEDPPSTGIGVPDNNDGTGPESDAVRSSASVPSDRGAEGDVAVTIPAGTGEEGLAMEEDVGGAAVCGGPKEELKMGGGDSLEEDEKAENENTGEGSAEAVQQVSYGFSCGERCGFSVSDLVWGKVKFHPWWPGQICNQSDASELALKHQRKDNFLVAYFGDRTFAWCDTSQLKRLPADFPSMERQSGSEAFVDGVNGALAEVSRRVELGLLCCCVPEEVCSGLKSQGRIENSGIRKGVKVLDVGKNFGRSSFQPGKLVGYIRSLAVSPAHAIDRFGLTVARAQLLAYHRSKGFKNLPDIFIGKGLLEESGEFHSLEDRVECSTPASVGEEKLSASTSKRAHQKSGSGSQLKRKSALEEGRKSKKLSELMKDPEEGNLENGFDAGFDKKLNVVALVPHDSEQGQSKKLDHVGDQEMKSMSSVPHKSFNVGECILRVASKLTSSPSVKSNGVAFQKSDERKDHGKESPFSLDDSMPSPEEIDNKNMSIPSCSSLDELLCQLFQAAKDPMTTYDFSPTVIGFFTGFLRFCALSPSDKFGYEMDEGKQNSHPVSGEDTKESEEVKHKRKQVPSPISREDMKPPEEVKRKRGRPRLNRGEDGKQPEEVRPKRGRPRLRPAEDGKLPEEVPRGSCQPCPISAEDKKPSDEVPRKRGRPRLKPAVNANQPEAVKRKRGRPPSVPSEGVKMHKEVKHKRGRPALGFPKVNSKPVETVVDGTSRETSVPETDLSKMIPAYMNDSYWTDVVICSTPEKKLLAVEKKQHGRKRKQYLIEGPEHTEKPAGETTGSQSSKMPIDASNQIQVPSSSPNKNCSLIPERRISYFGDKCIAELNPTAFILNFSNANSLPSETELVRIFSRYGPLKDAETEVQKHLNFAKVVFKRRADAEVAFTNARKYNFFGHALLSFWLRNFPLVSEDSPKSAFEGQTSQTLVSSRTSPLSSGRNGEAVMMDCIQKVEVAQRDEASVNCIKEALSGRNNSDMDQCAVDVIVAEGGEMFVDSGEILPFDGYQTTIVCGDTGIIGLKECLTSVNTSLGETQGQQEHEAPTAGAKSKDATDQERNGEPQRDARLEDPNWERVGICVSDNDKFIVVNEEVPSSQDVFDRRTSGPGFVESFVDEIGKGQGVAGVENVDNDGTDDRKDSAIPDNPLVVSESIASQGVTGVEMLNINGAGDKEDHDADSEKVLGNGPALEASHGTKAEASVADGDLVLQKLCSTEGPEAADYGRLEVSNTKRLGVDSNYLATERMEVVAGSDACNVIVHRNHEDKLTVVGQCAEGLSVTKDEVTQAADLSEHPDNDILVVPIPKTDEMNSEVDFEILDGVEQSDELDMHRAEHKGKDTDELPTDDTILEDSGICGSGPSLDCTSAISGSSQEKSYMDVCCLKVQVSGELNEPGDGSTVKAEMKYGVMIEDDNVEISNTRESSMLHDICTSDAQRNEGAPNKDSYDLKTETGEAPACEDHVEDLTGVIDAPVHGGGEDSLIISTHKLRDGVNFESLTAINECVGTSYGLTLVSGNKMDEAVDTSMLEKPECSKQLESCVHKMDMPGSSGAEEALNEKNGQVDCRIDEALAQKSDEMHADEAAFGVPGTGIIENTDSANLSMHDCRTDRSNEVDKNLDGPVGKTDDRHVDDGVTEALGNRTNEVASGNLTPDNEIGVVPLAGKRVAASGSNLDKVNIDGGILSKSIDVPDVSNFEIQARITDVSGKRVDASQGIADMEIASSGIKCNEVTDAVNLEAPDSMSVRILMPDVHLQMLVSQKATAGYNDEMVGISGANIVETLGASGSGNSDVVADRITDASMSEAPNSMNEIIHESKEHPEIPICLVGSVRDDDYMVDVPDSGADEVHASTLGIQDSGTVVTPGCGVHLQVLPCEAVSEPSCRKDDDLAGASNSEASGCGINEPSCSRLEDSVRKPNEIADVANFDVSGCGVNVGCYKNPEGSVRDKHDVHVGDVATADSNNQIKMTDDDKSEIHDGGAGISCDRDGHQEKLVKVDASMSMEIKETLDNKPDTTADSVNEQLFNNRSDIMPVHAEHLKAPVSKSDDVHVYSQDFGVKKVEEVADVHNETDVALEGDKHLEASICQTDKEGVPTEASSKGAGDLTGSASRETPECVSLSVPGPHEHLEVFSCKVDGHVDGSIKDGVKVDEMAGNLGAYDSMTDLAPEVNARDSKMAHKDGRIFCTMGEKTDASSSENLNSADLIYSHAEHQEISTCKTGDVDSDGGITNSDFRQEEIPETANSEVLNGE